TPPAPKLVSRSPWPPRAMPADATARTSANRVHTPTACRRDRMPRCRGLLGARWSLAGRNRGRKPTHSQIDASTTTPKRAILTVSRDVRLAVKVLMLPTETRSAEEDWAALAGGGAASARHAWRVLLCYLHEGLPLALVDFFARPALETGRTSSMVVR